MKYTKYTVHTTTVAGDLFTDAITAFGDFGLEIRDKRPLSEKDNKEMFNDIGEELLADLPEDDGKCEIDIYPPEDYEGDLYEVIERAMEDISLFVDTEGYTVEKSTVDDKDYKDKWKENFHAFEVAGTLIEPAWEASEHSEESGLSDASGLSGQSSVIKIDPGAAFGTGKHETTRLCLLEILNKDLSGAGVLDLGCGSGILGIAARKRGAKEVTFLDIDPHAVQNAKENAALNGVTENVRFLTGDILEDEGLCHLLGEGSFDLILANILADVLIPMAEKIYGFLAGHGKVITSGIIDFKEPAVREALEKSGFKNIETKSDGEWRMIRGHKG